jgi:starch synthase
VRRGGVTVNQLAVQETETRHYARPTLRRTLTDAHVSSRDDGGSLRPSTRYHRRPRMTGTSATLRVMGVSIPDVSDWSQSLPAGKWSQFFKALSVRTSLIGIARPALSKPQRYLALARASYPDKSTWLARAGFNLDRVDRLNTALARDLDTRRGSYDLIVQLQTLCSPRSAASDAPYVIYTDNTMALTQKVYPRFAPLSREAVKRWQAFEAEVCHGAQRVFTFSQFARRSVIEDYGCTVDQVVAIGAGANQLSPSLEGKDYSRRVALFVGHPFEAKGGNVLLSAWPLVRRRLPDAELIIVGPKRDPAPGFGHGVTWRGWVKRDQLAELYRSASAFVLPSMFDAWGHVFVEAMGHGLPCIGTDCCAMPELISDGITGRLVPRSEPGALAQAITELLSDPVRAEQMGRAGYSRVLAELTWPKVVDRLLQGVTVPGCSTNG